MRGKIKNNCASMEAAFIGLVGNAAVLHIGGILSGRQDNFKRMAGGVFSCKRF